MTNLEEAKWRTAGIGRVRDPEEREGLMTGGDDGRGEVEQAVVVEAGDQHGAEAGLAGSQVDVLAGGPASSLT